MMHDSITHDSMTHDSMTAHLGAGLHVALHAPQPGVEGVPGGRGSNPRSDTVGTPDDDDDDYDNDYNDGVKVMKPPPDDVLDPGHCSGEESLDGHIGQQGGAPVVECLLYVPAQ